MAPGAVGTRGDAAGPVLGSLPRPAAGPEAGHEQQDAERSSNSRIRKNSAPRRSEPSGAGVSADFCGSANVLRIREGQAKKAASLETPSASCSSLSA
jgi:hypothetical protein